MICQSQRNPFPAASAACAAAALLDAPSLDCVPAIPQPQARSLVIGPSCVPHAKHPQAACAASLPAPLSPLPAAAVVLASLPAVPPPATARAAAVAGSASNSQRNVPPFSTAVHPRALKLQRQTGHCTPRRSPAATRLWRATAAAAVLLCSLCVVAAALQDMTACPEWSAAALSAGRRYLAATSLPSQGLAIFAGGVTDGLWFCC